MASQSSKSTGAPLTLMVTVVLSNTLGIYSSREVSFVKEKTSYLKPQCGGTCRPKNINMKQLGFIRTYISYHYQLDCFPHCGFTLQVRENLKNLNTLRPALGIFVLMKCAAICFHCSLVLSQFCLLPSELITTNID